MKLIFSKKKNLNICNTIFVASSAQSKEHFPDFKSYGFDYYCKTHYMILTCSIYSRKANIDPRIVKNMSKCGRPLILVIDNLFISLIQV